MPLNVPNNNITEREWARIRNTYFELRTILVEDHEKLSQEQQMVINEIKKCYQALDRKYGLENTDPEDITDI